MDSGSRLKTVSKEMQSQRKVKFLGHIVSHRGIETDPDKTRAIQEWSKPASLKEVRSLVGKFVLSKSIREFSEVCKPLHHLTENQRPVGLHSSALSFCAGDLNVLLKWRPVSEGMSPQNWEKRRQALTGKCNQVQAVRSSAVVQVQSSASASQVQSRARAHAVKCT